MSDKSNQLDTAYPCEFIDEILISKERITNFKQGKKNETD